MSESARALCRIIEARPFLTLTDEELVLLTYLVEQHVTVLVADPVSTTLHGRLVDETARRREFERGQRNAYDQADAALHARVAMDFIWATAAMPEEQAEEES